MSSFSPAALIRCCGTQESIKDACLQYILSPDEVLQRRTKRCDLLDPLLTIHCETRNITSNIIFEILLIDAYVIHLG